MLSALILALSGFSQVNAHPAHNNRAAAHNRRGTVLNYGDVDTPKNWDLTTMEPYSAYHYRFVAIGCAALKGTDFYNECCKPRKVNQTDADFPYQCSLAAHVTDLSVEEFDNQASKANAKASGFRKVEIKSSSSAVIASKSSVSAASVSSVSASKASVVSVSLASVASVESRISASKASVAAASESAAAAAAASRSSAAEASKPTSGSDGSSGSDSGSSGNDSGSSGSDSGSSGDSSGSGSGSSGSDSGSSGIIGHLFSGGQATWFTQDGGQGACGEWKQDSFYLVALQTQTYGDGSNCKKLVKVTNTANGKSVIAEALDECPTCQGNANSLDLSLAAFDAIGARDTGMLPISWGFIESGTLGPV